MNETNLSNIENDFESVNDQILLRHKVAYLEEFKETLNNEIENIKSIIQEKIYTINHQQSIKKINVTKKIELESKIDYKLFGFNDIHTNEKEKYIQVTNHIENYLRTISPKLNQKNFNKNIELLIKTLKEGFEYTEDEFAKLQKVLNNFYKYKNITNRKNFISILRSIKILLQIQEIIKDIDDIEKSIEINKKEIKELKERRESFIKLKYNLENNIDNLKFMKFLNNEKFLEIIYNNYNLKKIRKKIIIIETRKKIPKVNEILYQEFEEIYDELKKYPFKKFSEVTKDYYYKKSKNGKRYLDNNNEIKLRNYRERVRRYKEGKPYKEYLRNHSQVEHYDKKKHLMKINKSKTKSNH